MAEPQRVALVTGGNRGIGLAICRQLAQKGMQVILSGRDEAQLRHGRASLLAEGIKVATIHLDVTDHRMLEKAPDLEVSFIGDWIQRQYGRLDVLVNNAGVVPDKGGFGDSEGDGGSILNTERAAFDLGMETHFHGPLALCRTLIPLMKVNGYGRIVNMSTGMARLADMDSGWPAYRMSKVALNTLTRILSQELLGTNILVNAASPGWVRTRMGGDSAPLTAEQGADTAVWLATLPDNGPTGGFFTDRKPTPW